MREIVQYNSGWCVFFGGVRSSESALNFLSCNCVTYWLEEPTDNRTIHKHDRRRSTFISPSARFGRTFVCHEEKVEDLEKRKK